jgi:hypothetical protein
MMTPPRTRMAQQTPPRYVCENCALLYCMRHGCNMRGCYLCIALACTQVTDGTQVTLVCVCMFLTHGLRLMEIGMRLFVCVRVA